MKNSTYKIEKRRGFQPPWYTVVIYTCGQCAKQTTLRRSWAGAPPPGAIVCDCGNRLPLV